MPLPPENPASPALRARPRHALLLVAGLAALGGCQALSGSGGVMPETDVGPPPSLRGSVPTRAARRGDPDEAPSATAPTRRLDLPKNVRGEARSEASADRRIRREDIEGAETGRSGSSGGMAPALTPGGGMGLGGRF